MYSILLSFSQAGQVLCIIAFGLFTHKMFGWVEKKNYVNNFYFINPNVIEVYRCQAEDKEMVLMMRMFTVFAVHTFDKDRSVLF